MFRFYLQLLSETFLILRRIKRDMIKNVYRSSCKVPFILARLKLEFSCQRMTCRVRTGLEAAWGPTVVVPLKCQFYFIVSKHI